MATLGRRKVPPMTPAEKRAALTQSQAMTGFVAETTEDRLFLKCAFSTDDIATVWLDPNPGSKAFLGAQEAAQKPAGNRWGGRETASRCETRIRRLVVGARELERDRPNRNRPRASITRSTQRLEHDPISRWSQIDRIVL
jgi:hypothetical protein